MCIKRVQLVLAVALLFTTALSNECIFNTSVPTLNAASDFAVSASTDPGNGAPSFVKFAPTLSRRLSNELLTGRPASFFDDLFNRRHNSQSYMWASAQNEQRSGAALAHLISCATERFARQENPNHHSLCTSSVSGDQTSQSEDDRCNGDFRTLLLIGDDNNTNRPNRTGTQACWCDTMCTQANAVFQDTSGASSQTRNIRSFVVLEETSQSPTMAVSEYENGEDGNNTPGTNWFVENLAQAQSPIGKGVFPRRDEALSPGDVLRSLRLINVVDQVGSEGECPTVSGALSDLELRMMASVEQQISSTLNTAISGDLVETAAKQGEILLTITSAITAVLAFGWLSTATKLMNRIKQRPNWRAKLPLQTALILVVLVELAVENVPIYLLLRQEIAARDHVETIGVEVIGAGNELAVLRISNEEFIELMSALVVIVVRNKGTSVVGIAVAAVVLSLLSICSIVSGFL